MWVVVTGLITETQNVYHLCVCLYFAKWEKDHYKLRKILTEINFWKELEAKNLEIYPFLIDPYFCIP